MMLLSVLFIGSVPGPIFFGFVMDESCQKWQGSCGARGACLLYDRRMMAWKLLLSTIALKLFSVVLFTIAHISYKSASDIEDKERDSKEMQDIDGRKESYRQFEKLDATVNSFKNSVYEEAADETGFVE